MDVKGRTALITGASTGIGAAYARELAARGAALILVARRESKLKELADDLRTTHGVRVDVAPLDLARPGAAEILAGHVSELGRTVDILINNAGFATHGDVATADPERLTEQVSLNCTTVVDLTTRFLPAMIAGRSGVVVNVASTAAFQPIAHMAVYGATKAFVLSFTEALWAETAGTGVRVVAICPGSTDTPFFDVVGAEEASMGKRRSPEQVVATTFAALDRGRPSAVDGRVNALLSRLPRLLPRRATLRIAERAVRPNPA
ncbi:Serine 3-dehydrogenase [Actinomadura rubteroloni]|uniref:Serine 3-dehydrogenase n=2 Tax=Actinomadura rubteroloni TaxID=1926885 RepID=A0A2P4UBS0_9ACTN|nr:Serine 3-dehydrogenase [Actinomadura rubteroloni]